MNGKRFLKEKAAQPRKVLTPQESETWRQTVWRRFRRHRLAMVSCVVLLFLVLAALVGPLLCPYDPNETVGAFSQPPSLQHWLGTDQIGRDQLSRLLSGTRVSLLVGAVLSLVNLVRLLLSYPGNELVCVTVTLSLFATVVLAKTIGGALPMLAKLVRADPAIMAAPLITTIVDALSLVLYFTIASRLLHL